MNQKTVVIYHSADFDGIFCREIAKKFLSTENVEYIGWNYGDPVPSVSSEDKLYILDLSIDKLMDHPNLTWIDHHKSALDKYLLNGTWTITLERQAYCIDGVAACRLAWQWFSRNLGQLSLPGKDHYLTRQISEPLAVRLAGEYDIWDRRDPNAELFQHGLRSRELSESIWDSLLIPDLHEDRMVIELLESGESIQYAKTKENESIIRHNGYDEHWEGLNFLCCNHARFNSHLFTAGIKEHHRALLGWRFDGGKYHVSLYHAPGHEDIDLSVIAQKYGGGGHRGACGFTCTVLPF